MRRSTGLVAGALAVGVIAAVGWYAHASTQDSDSTPPLWAKLDAVVVNTLEKDPAWPSVAIGESKRPVCAATVFGVSPTAAKEVAEVKQIYAWVACKFLADGDRGSTVNVSTLTGVSMPIAMEVGPPPRYEVPEDGDGHAASIRRIFPASVQKVALDYDPAIEPDGATLDQRVKDAN